MVSTPLLQSCGGGRGVWAQAAVTRTWYGGHSPAFQEPLILVAALQHATAAIFSLALHLNTHPCAPIRASPG